VCNWALSPRNTYCPEGIPKQPLAVAMGEIIQGSVKLVATVHV
jgi:hypothetical protein